MPAGWQNRPMRCVVQRVTRAEVRVDGETVASVGPGLLVLAGVTHDDTPDDARAMAAKLAGLRIFGDDQGRMNQSVVEVGGEVLVVSQFTLYGAVRRGRRPSFTDAADPGVAEPLVEELVESLESAGIVTRAGVFGARMEVDLVNDGPVTLVVEARAGAVL